MKASSGAYYVGLDHVRALAAYLVFIWHFLHIHDGHITPLDGTFDVFAFSLLAEGHTGVSLFMVLSGYLFAKITQGKDIHYGRFFWARFVRLAPMLGTMMVLYAIKETILEGWGGPEFLAYLQRLASGFVVPAWPNGGWSLTVELHFYLIFPLLLILERRRPLAMAGIILLALALRFGMAALPLGDQMRDFSYWTIIGRIDQFVIGMLLAYYGRRLAQSHLLALAAGLGVLALYRWFAGIGGYYGNETYPDIWVWLLTAEGLCYGIVIAWYDAHCRFGNTGVSGVLAKVGAASYSIYLLHFFVVFEAARQIDRHIWTLDTFYAALIAGTICFALVAMGAWIVYRYYESWFLRFRVPYLLGPAATGSVRPSGA